jgi:N-dimethylarginine dimethylaminohydrolase
MVERARVPRQRRRGFVSPRAAELRHYAMCPPVFLHGDGDPGDDAGPHGDRRSTGCPPCLCGDLAMRQWERLRATLIALGHRVSLMPGRPGLPDMVFAARSATVVGDRVLGARHRSAQCWGQTSAAMGWFAGRGFRARLEPVFAHEGERDLLPAGPRLLAAVGPLTERAAHAEAQAFLGLPVVALELADPRFPHLGAALAVLGEHTAAYYPGAFTTTALRRLTRVFPERIEVEEADALAFGLDVVCDGRSVVMGERTPGFAARLSGRGFRPIELDLSEFAAHGAGARSCVLELRAAR